MILGDVPSLLEMFHRRRDRALGDFQVLGDVGNAGVAVLLPQLVNRHQMMGGTVSELVLLVSLPDVFEHQNALG